MEQISSVRTVGGGVVRTLGCVSVPFSISGHECQEHTFHLMSASDMPVCCIVGADLISDLGLVLNFEALNFALTTSRGVVEVPFLVRTEVAMAVEFCLSQLEVERSGMESPLSLPLRFSTEQVRELQRSDASIRRLLEVLGQGTPSNEWRDPVLSEYRRCPYPLVIKEGVGCVVVDGTPIILVTREFIIELALKTHWDMSHPGKNKLVGILKKLAWHPSIGGVVGDICSSCPRCQYYKVAPLNVAPPILKIEGGGPFKSLAVDLLSLPLTRKGHIGCLVSVDHFTKWAVIVPIKNKRPDTVAAALEDRVFPALPRIPERILWG